MLTSDIGRFWATSAIGRYRCLKPADLNKSAYFGIKLSKCHHFAFRWGNLRFQYTILKVFSPAFQLGKSQVSSSSHLEVMRQNVKNVSFTLLQDIFLPIFCGVSNFRQLMFTQEYFQEK